MIHQTVRQRLPSDAASHLRSHKSTGMSSDYSLYENKHAAEELHKLCTETAAAAPSTMQQPGVLVTHTNLNGNPSEMSAEQ
jgi:hypothetical protein